jgi:hypothetical protein
MERILAVFRKREEEEGRLPRAIKDLVHKEGLLTPPEIISDYVQNRRLDPLCNIGVHPQPALVHTFQDWLSATWKAVPALDPWEGTVNERPEVSCNEREKILFDLFCMELARRGVDLTDEVKEEAWKAYLND